MSDEWTSEASPAELDALQSVAAIAEECDNRQRWQDDSGRGTLHYISAEVAARAAAEVHDGDVVSLARPVHPIPLTGGPHAAAADVPAPLATRCW